MQALLGEHWRSVNLILGETPDPRVFELPDMQLVSISDRDIHLIVRGDVNPLIRRLGQLELRDIAITTPDIEDVFLRFYGPSTASGPIAPAEPQQAEEAIS